jgi:hypothetical protein
VIRTPDFDELIGPDIDQAERDRLRTVHELLLQAGPPAELTPEFEAGPTLSMLMQRRGRRGGRRVMLLAAALTLVAIAFLTGYITGNGGGDGLAPARTLSLVGTNAAPGALASLRVQPADESGNWPMRISVTGLPKLPSDGYYSVYLERDGKPFAPCGYFIVAPGKGATSVWISAPYDIRQDDTWVVTKQLPGHHELGPVVLRPSV